MAKLMNAYQLARRLKVSHTTIYRWVEMGMPHRKTQSGLRSIMRFDLDEVREWKKENKI